jgi:hypothetical protein
VFKTLVDSGRCHNRDTFTQDCSRAETKAKVAVVEVTVKLDRNPNETVLDVWEDSVVKNQIRKKFPFAVWKNVKRHM